jgi:hypothetical protein
MSGWFDWIFLLLTVSPGGTNDPVISEIMARNEKTLRDEDGDFSDWIEIQNLSMAPVDLHGWSLTDDPQHLRKWRFPAVTVAPGAHSIVFASGKNRARAGEELHANFDLDDRGEYLALVRPDGKTVVSEFSPAFPAQKADVSFGIAVKKTGAPLVPASHPCRIYLPRDAQPPATWNGAPEREPFPDGDGAGWFAGSSAAGFDRAAGDLALPAPDGCWPFDGDARDASGNGHHGLRDGGRFRDDHPKGVVAGQSIEFDGIDDIVTMTIDVAETEYTAAWWFKTDERQGGLYSVWGQDLVYGGYDRDLILREGAVLARLYNDESITASERSLADGEWHHLAHVVGRSVGGQHVYLDGKLAASGRKTESDYDHERGISVGYARRSSRGHFKGLIDDLAVWSVALSAEQVAALANGQSPPRRTSIAPKIQTNLRERMLEKSASAYLRIPFDVPPADGALRGAGALRLRVACLGGFIAYLNGVEIGGRESGAALRSDAFDVPGGLDLLRAGRNVLAVHGTSRGRDSPAFFVRPQLDRVSLSSASFLARPTPSAPNSWGVAGFVAPPRFLPERQVFQPPLRVEIMTETAGAQIYYTTDGSEPSPTNSRGTLYREAISLERTTTLRATAIKDGWQGSGVETHTFIDIESVARQPAGHEDLPAMWGLNVPADYTVDANVERSGPPDHSFADALLALPIVSVVCNPDDLFGRDHGIYYWSRTRGRLGEMPASVELLYPDGAEGFKVDAGIRIQGLSSTSHRFTPKHTLRLSFRRRYGAPELKFPLFGGGVQGFDELVLKSPSTDSWPAEAGGFHQGVRRFHPDEATYLRDQWMRDTQRAMGHPSCRGIYVHLFLNGLYWGLYNLLERPNGAFNAAHLGGRTEEYDVVKDYAELQAGTKEAWDAMMALAEAVSSGELAAYQTLQGRDASGRRDPKMEKLLDVDNLIDYVVLHVYSAAEDWPKHNWWAARRRGPESEGFKFLVWDQEISNNSLVRMHPYGAETDRIEDPSKHPNAAFLSGKLSAHPDYRRRFIDRLHRLVTGDGLLTPAACQRRWDALAGQIDQAIVAESARWGGAKRVPAYRRESEWLTEMAWMREVYWPGNHRRAMQRFRNMGMMPEAAAPLLEVEGRPMRRGTIARGARVALAVRREVEVPLVDRDTDLSALVPRGGEVADRWRLIGYEEGSSGETWRRGRGGVGYDTQNEFPGSIGVDLGTELYGKSAPTSLYVRIPFTVPDAKTLESLERLVLEVAFDDGFAAYLNGTRVAAANAPPEEALSWTSSALETSEAAIGNPAPYAILDFQKLLKPGRNVLALHALNDKPGSSDFFIAVRLLALKEAIGQPGAEVFYTTDGSDPIDGRGRPYREPIAGDGTTTVKARSRLGSEWSALEEGAFTIDGKLSR